MSKLYPVLFSFSDCFSKRPLRSVLRRPLIGVILSLLLLNGLSIASDSDSESESAPHKSFYFIRHGVTDWHKDLLAEGPMDLPLSGVGRAQVGQSLVACKDAPFSTIITSNLKRCWETAEIIAATKTHGHLLREDGLQERHFGDWSKCKEAAAKIVKEAPEGPCFYKAIQDKIEAILPADAESQSSFEQRIYHTLQKVLEKAKGTPLLVAHGCVRYALQKQLKIISDMTAPVDYAKLIFFEGTDHGYKISYVEDMGAVHS